MTLATHRERPTGASILLLVLPLTLLECSAAPTPPGTDDAAGPGEGLSLSVIVDPANPDSRSQVVVALSMASQFDAQGLTVNFVPATPYPGTSDDWMNLQYDWGLNREGVAILPLPDDPTDNSTMADLATLRNADGTVITQWTLNALARHANLSTSQLTRLFNASLGAPPIAVIQRIRAERMADFLVNTNMSVAEFAA
ncbi:helix-turn-helix domain-containing protein [Microbacterium nymphoidis]|uniref:helix-turn-helix domain-containing protein n=1 Tax=Microbacterium nymphoidis TaxID=2898586 RepID=UPI001E494CCD|nr:helix-turn-helix domain-containing protein [Microbacterium nymphoidis]MCD2498468.1 helix-turn-helix domain-containing protein [Microbacterium nymphoidis]